MSLVGAFVVWPSARLLSARIQACMSSGGIVVEVTRCARNDGRADGPPAIATALPLAGAPVNAEAEQGRASHQQDTNRRDARTRRQLGERRSDGDHCDAKDRQIAVVDEQAD